MTPQIYSDLGFNQPLQPEELPQSFSTAFDIYQENKDLWEREGEVIDL